MGAPAARWQQPNGSSTPLPTPLSYHVVCRACSSLAQLAPSASLQAGEVLFLPSYWWHDVRAIPPDGPASRGTTTELRASRPSADAPSRRGKPDHTPPREVGSRDAVSPPDASEPPADGAACGMTASINYFFTPYFRKANYLRHFSHEPFYDFLRRGAASPEGAADRDRWRRETRTRTAAGSAVKSEL